MISLRNTHPTGLRQRLGRSFPWQSWASRSLKSCAQGHVQPYGSFTLAAVLLVTVGLMPTATAQRTGDIEELGADQPTLPSNVELVSPDATQSGLFSIPAGKRVMREAEQAVSAQNYELAARKFQDSRRLMNQLSKFYEQLRSSFLAIDNRASDSHRKKALEAAQLRDQATYKLGLVYVAQNKPEKAIPLFIEIVRSQNPTRELGTKSYQQLFELGFVDVPYPRNSAPAIPSTSPDATPEQT